MSDTLTTSIDFDGVGKRFGETWVLRDIDLGIRPGTIHGLIGPSGCGKTTTVRLALGYHRPDEGTVRVLGRDPVTRTNEQRKEIGYLPQHPVLFDELSLRQNLNYHASLSGAKLRRAERLDEVLELVGLADDGDKRVSEASGGMRRRLALAATMFTEPPLLFLDEPTAGVDPILRGELWNEFRRQRDAGTTFVVTTQFVEEAAYCDQVAVLADGGVRADASPSELVALAFGGRRFDIDFDDTVTGSVLEAVCGIDGIASASTTGPSTIRIVVESSATGATGGESRGLDDAVRRALDDASGHVEISSISQVPVDWNDAFAAIVSGGDADDERRNP